MKCELCAEFIDGPDHEISEKHIRNKVLFDYAVTRKQFAGNRKGVILTCNVNCSPLVIDCDEKKIRISVKPKEAVKFSFTLKNDSKKDNVVVAFVQMMHTRLNFRINEHGLGVGCAPVTVPPKRTLQREIFVTFQSPDVGQYEMPIMFSMHKPATKENIVIVRDMVVFVEEQPAVHTKTTSPYAQKQVTATKLFRATLAERSDDMFRIPKDHKTIYASDLKPKKNASEAEKALYKDIRDIFDVGVTSENYVRYFHNLLWYEETIVRINLKKYNMSDVYLKQQGKTFCLYVPGLAEKRPSLMRGDLLFVKPHSDDDVMFEAIVADISENVAFIRGMDVEFFKYYSPETMFDVRFFMSRLPLERMHHAVSLAASNSPNQRRVFPVENQKIPRINSIDTYFNLEVERNPEQRSVVEHILAGSSGTAPYLLHGPPGTGKTVTIVEAILQLVRKNPKNRILVCTDSNMAADHVGTVLIQHLHMLSGEHLMLRANSKYRVWGTLPKSLEMYCNGHDRDSFEVVKIQNFMKYNIVITTLSHSARFARELVAKNYKRHITHLFIDEAAQASEPSCLIPVCGLLSPRGVLVLAGDPLQLGPVVISHEARRRGLGLSLMERLKMRCELYSDERNDPNYMVMLRNNFRSNPDILEIPNAIFYKDQLRAVAGEDPISKVDILGERAASRAIVFHGVLSKEQRMGKSPSFYNAMELEIVQMYVTRLVKEHHVLPEDIGIVTPYIRQVYKIKTWLDTQRFSGKIEVGTVEAFQGKEKRVIIISTVRANCSMLDHDAKFQLGFLVDDKRFNVALTRAKAKAIIIGNPLCLQRDIKWRKYINKCREFGTYFGYDAEKFDEDQKDIVSRISPLLKDLKIGKDKAQG